MDPLDGALQLGDVLPCRWRVLLLLLLSRFSRVWRCATPETAAHQAPPSLGFSRQEHWSGLPFPSPMFESEKWKWSRSVVSDSLLPHGLQPTRLLRPWDFPGKSTGVGCHCLLQGGGYLAGNDWEEPGKLSFLHLSENESCSVVSDSLQPQGILQARLLKWVAFTFSRGSSQPRDQTQFSVIAGGFFTDWAIREICLSPQLISHFLISHHTNFNKGSAHGFSSGHWALPDCHPSWVVYCQVVRASLSFFNFLVKIIYI